MRLFLQAEVAYLFIKNLTKWEGCSCRLFISQTQFSMHFVWQWDKKVPQMDKNSIFFHQAIFETVLDFPDVLSYAYALRLFMSVVSNLIAD